MSKILVIGCASRDKIHFDQLSKTIDTIGGAGLYTALAVRATGTACTLFAPYPQAPESRFAAVRNKLEWIGPAVDDDDIPSLEIAHHGNDQATLKGASWAGESLLTTALLPEDLSQFSYIHIAALSTTGRQLEFLQFLRERTSCKISAGTYGHPAKNEPEQVKQLLAGCDLFFMNENEAQAIEFTPRSSGTIQGGRSGQIVCVTRGKNGASIYSSSSGKKDFAAITIAEVDPTGAGDTFCGTILGALAKGMSIDTSALLAVERAARVISESGPAALQRLIK